MKIISKPAFNKKNPCIATPTHGSVIDSVFQSPENGTAFREMEMLINGNSK